MEKSYNRNGHITTKIVVFTFLENLIFKESDQLSSDYFVELFGQSMTHEVYVELC